MRQAQRLRHLTLGNDAATKKLTHHMVTSLHPLSEQLPRRQHIPLSLHRIQELHTQPR